MGETPKFELGDIKPIARAKSDSGAEKAEKRSKPAAGETPGENAAREEVSVGNGATGPAPSLGSDASGLQIAAGLDAAGYHPIVLFGNANSGKTSLLLSLFALLRTEPQLATGLELGEPILHVDSPYGRFLRDQAESFYGKKTQDFIEGRASPKTAIETPFFIPVVFRPKDKPEVKIAFMESNGEWYRPDRQSEKLFPALRKQIEEFLAVYQGPVTFIHMLPYTQQVVYGTNSDQLTDADEMKEAALAVAGALLAYQRVRPNKQDDRHLMLVSKWDAHDRQEQDRAGVLLDTNDEPETFANERYAQAMSIFRGMGLRPDQLQITSYCAGIIAGQMVTMPRKGDELRDAVLNYPTQLWRWLYKATLIEMGEHPVDPFPPEPKPGWFTRLLNKLF